MQNPFAKLFTREKLALFQPENKSVLGVDIGASSIKVVQLRKDKGRAVLETYGEIAAGPYAKGEIGQAAQLPTPKIVEALADVVREANVTAKRSAFSIPLRSSFLTLIELPVTDERTVDQVMPIEARKYVPVPINEVQLDWWLVPKRESEGSTDAISNSQGRDEGKSHGVEVLLAAIHTSVLSQYKELAEKAALSSSVFEIEMFSAVRSTIGHELLPVLIMDMGASSTKISVVDFGVMKFTQTIAKGSQDITLALSKSLSVSFAKAEEIKRKVGLIGKQEGDVVSIVNPVLEYIFFEANQALGNYQKKYKRSIAKVILIGSGSLLSGLLTLAKDNFSVEVLYGEPFKKVEAPAFLEGVLATAGPTFAVSVGLALRALQEIS